MRARLRCGALAGALVLALAGCGDGSSEGSGPEDSAPSPAASPTESAGTGTPTEEPEEAPSAPAASGEVLSSQVVQVRVPQGWETDTTTESVQVASDDETDFYMALMVDTDYTSRRRGGGMSLDELARSARNVLQKPNRVRVLDDVTLDGVDFYHLAGPDPYAWLEYFGTSREGLDVLVKFEFPLGTPKKARQRVVDSVLPTVEWL